MKGCRRCGCLEFAIVGVVQATKYRVIGQENARVAVDETDFKVNEDADYCCTNCNAIYTDTQLAEMEDEYERM